MKSLAALIPFIALLFFGCADADSNPPFTQEESISLNASAGDFFELNVQRANLVIRPAAPDAREVQVRIVASIQSRSPKKANHALATIESNFERLAYGVTGSVRGGEPAVEWLGMRRTFPTINIEIHVPRGLRLQITSGSGRIDIRDVEGSFIFATSSGSVHAHNLNGDFSARTGSGNFNGTQLTGRLLLESGSGNFSMQGHFPSLSVRSGSGSIQITSSAQITEPATIQSAAGNINISLNPATEFSLSARSAAGNLNIQFPSLVPSVSERRNIIASTPNATLPIRIQSASGNITLSAAQ